MTTIIVTVLFLGVAAWKFMPDAYFHFMQLFTRLFGIDVETGFAANIYLEDDIFLRHEQKRKLAKWIILILNSMGLIFGSSLVVIAVAGLAGHLLYDTVVRQVRIVCDDKFIKVYPESLFL